MRRVAIAAQFAGIAVLLIVVGKYHAAVVSDTPYDLTAARQFQWLLVYAGLLSLAVYAFGLPESGRNPREAVLSSIAATASASMAMSGLQLAVGGQLMPRFVVFLGAFLLIPWFVGIAAIARDARSREAERDRVVVVADWSDGANLSAELEDRAEHAATVVAIMAPRDASVTADGVRPLCDAARRESATVIVLDRVAQLDPMIIEQAAELHESGMRIRTLSIFCEQWLGKVPVGELERVSLMFDIGEVHRARYGRVKRILDVVLALLGGVVLVSAIPIVMLCNAFGNRGPLWYRQPRVGRGGKVFSIVKFRTMRAGEGPTTWTASADPRITPFGHFLRRTHLDELPQMWNILRGDLSIVGPRPEQPIYVEELAAKLPFYQVRHMVRPGLTGWAQVKYGYAGDERDALEKLQYEVYYLRYQRLSFDLRIIVRTLRSVVLGRGR